MKDINELKALIRLVDEPDEKLFDQVKKHIFDYGIDAVVELEAALEMTFDDSLQKRLQSLIHEIQYNYTLIELHTWAKFNHTDLLKGYMLITRYQYPDLNPDTITREVGRIAQEVWLELNNNLTALEKVKVLNHILFDINKFGGNTSNLYSPDNYYLKNLFETHKGNPLSIGMLYIIIANSLRIPIYGVDLPRHFVLAYVDESVFPLQQDDTDEEVLFYLNPYNQGAVFTKKEIELFVKQMKLEPKPSFFKPCNNITIIRRMINGLIESYISNGNNEKAAELQHIVTALDI
jgi:regulator of sirC expression with transglutaminase-like and TPR domain